MVAMTSQRMTDAPVPLAEHLPTADKFVMMAGTWHTFKAMLALRGDCSRPRMAFFDGVIELMSPSRPHEGIKFTIEQLIAVFCETHGITFTGYGSWTHEDDSEEAGLEPDACYVFGDNPGAADRADLAIEVVWSRGGLKKLEIYRRLRVPEVWVWENDSIRVFALHHDSYLTVEQSRFLPTLDLEVIARLATVRPTSEATATFRDVLTRRA